MPPQPTKEFIADVPLPSSREVAYYDFTLDPVLGVIRKEKSSIHWGMHNIPNSKAL